MNGLPWGSATLDQPLYAKFHAGYTKFMENNPDGVVTDSNHQPNAWGAMFGMLPKPAIRVIALRMLHPDPEKRAAIHDILGDRWIKTIECCSAETEEETLRLAKTRSDKFDAGKGGVKNFQIARKLHNHLPPKVHKFPQYRFDMGDGYS